MKRIALGIALVAVVTGCEASTDPIDGVGNNGPDGGAVTQAQATGDWTFTLQRTATLACGTGSLPSNQPIFAHLDVLTNGTLTTSTSLWQTSLAAPVRPLAGTLRFTDGFANLTLFASSTNTSSGMELRGTITSTGTFNGTATDPAPGLNPVFSSTGCAYTATGVKG